MEYDNTREIQSREKAMMDIEQTMRDINGIHQDLQSILERQSIVLDTIADNMDHADSVVIRGTEEITQAQSYQSNAQTTKWTLFGIIGAIYLTLSLRLGLH